MRWASLPPGRRGDQTKLETRGSPEPLSFPHSMAFCRCGLPGTPGPPALPAQVTMALGSESCVSASREREAFAPSTGCVPLSCPHTFRTLSTLQPLPLVGPPPFPRLSGRMLRWVACARSGTSGWQLLPGSSTDYMPCVCGVSPCTTGSVLGADGQWGQGDFFLLLSWEGWCPHSWPSLVLRRRSQERES